MSYLNDKTSQALHGLFAEPVFNKYRQHYYASSARNEVHADWISNVMNTLQNISDTNVSANLINDKTGKVHTVDSMVADLKDRVKLDSIEKAASTKGTKDTKEFPLSALAMGFDSATEEDDAKKNIIWDKMLTFVESHVNSHHGHADTPAIMHDLRLKFGEDMLNEIGIKKVKDLVERVKGEFHTQDIDALLPPAYTGDPIPLDTAGEVNVPLFENIRL